MTVGFNGATFDYWRNNFEAIVLASAARTADTDSADQINYNAKGLALLLNVTAVSSGQINGLLIKARVGSSYVTIYQFTSLAISTTGQRAFLIYPGAASAGSWTAAPLQGVIPRNWRLTVDHNDANSITYDVVASYIL